MFILNINKDSTFTPKELVNKSGRLFIETIDYNIPYPCTIIEAKGKEITIGSGFPTDIKEANENIINISLLIDDTDQKLNVDSYEYIPRDQASNAQETFVEKVLSNVRWNDAYKLGFGVDAITSQICKKAVEPKGAASSPSKSIKTYAEIISNSSEYSRFFDVSLGGHYNTGTVDISGSMSYMNEVTFSESSMSIVLQYSNVDASYEESEYILSSEAKKLAKEKSKFRNVYGDYFVAGVKMGSRFTAVYTCTSRSSSEMNSFKASISGKSEMFSLATSAEFRSLAKSNNIQINVKLYYEGCKGTPTYTSLDDITNVYKAIKWFTENYSPIPLYAKLVHYSIIDNEISGAIPIDPSAFIKEAELYSYLWRMVGAAKACPKNYSSKMNVTIENLRRKILANQTNLASDRNILEKLKAELIAFNNDLNNIESCHKQYRLIKASSENGVRDRHESSSAKSKAHWVYGNINYPGAQVVKHDIAQDGHIGWREKTVSFNNSNKKIVGYVVNCCWKDGTGGAWWSNSGPSLLGHNISLTVKSYYDRGYHWMIDFYVVDNNKIDFE